MTGESESKTLKRFVETIEVREAFGHLNIALVPLGGEGHGQLDYILAADAIEAGKLEVTEVAEGGSVSELKVSSTADEMVLLLDGEELIGAKQNRILNTTILLAPKAETTIPVSCVEQGRWRYRSRSFASGVFSPSKLRGHKSRHVGESLRRRGRAESDQAAVWQDVAHCMAATGATSATMAMHDVIEQRRNSIDGYLNALNYPAGTRGVVAAINGRFAAVDLFDKPQTLQRVWRRLITGYVLDAIGSRESKGKAFTANGARALLDRIAEIPCRAFPSAGLGEDWRFEAQDVVGQALVVQDVCVHLGAFPNDNTGRGSEPADHIAPPSRRWDRRRKNR